MTKNNQTYYYHADGLGSIIAITDSSGNVVQRYEYDSFGNISYQQDSSFNQPYTYTGREYDEESGLYYYRARYYDARIGRFISEDPIGLAGGINFYAYVGNNPINATDPSGEVAIVLPCLANPACVGAILSGSAFLYYYFKNPPPPPLCDDETWNCKLIGERALPNQPEVKTCEYVCLSNKGGMKSFSLPWPRELTCPQTFRP